MIDSLCIAAISTLRQRLPDDMAVQRFSQETQRNYIRDVGRFVTHLGRSPHTATSEEVRQFQIEQHGAGLPIPTMNSIVSALRFCFTYTLDRPDLARKLVRTRHPRNLPVVLSRDEVARLLNATTLPQAPGGALGRQRGVMHPQGWLFPGQNAMRSICTRQLHRVAVTAAHAASIRKRVGPHTLRYSFATHLLEDGVDVRVIQALLGHARLDSTALYIRAATRTVRAMPSPPDTLGALATAQARPDS
ncbi:Tyrosine recombinase XerD (plasmid) [Komagataeibacter saccharivorans]|nr:Tyrosine recombinase XerD [Komagataeibacter saccharivorans]